MKHQDASTVQLSFRRQDGYTRTLPELHEAAVYQQPADSRQGKSQPYNQTTEDVLPELDGVSALQSYRALPRCNCKRCRFVTDLDVAVGISRAVPLQALTHCK